MGIISNLLFGDNSKKTDYKDALYNKYYRDITENTFDKAYGDNKDYLNNNYEGGYDKYKSDLMFGLQDNYKNSVADYKANRYNIFGNGLIGGLLNPIAQTASGVGDLAGLALSGGKSNAWDSSKNALGVSRDWLSDLGAAGETALTFLAPGATKGASIGSKMAKAGLMGAGYGATGSLRDMGSENFDPGQLALSTAIGGGVGAGIAGLGGLWNKYTSKTMPVTKTGDAMPYQEALNNLKNNASGATYSDTATNLPAVRGLDTARITLDNLDNDTLKQLYRSGLKNARSASGANEATTAIKNSKNLLQDFLDKGIPTATTYETRGAKGLGEALKNLKTNVSKTKTGNKVANLLKTKKGKVLAGAGGGLLLSQLMRGNNSKSGELTDEEMNELYNYIYGGGQ